MQKRIIAPEVYFDGENLIEYGDIIPVENEKQQRIIELLLRARGKAVSYSELYQYAYDIDQNEYSNGIAPNEKKGVQDLYTKMPAALKKYVKNVTNKGYKLLIQETFKVDPQFTTEKKNAEEVFILSHNNIRQDIALADMQKRAFMREPYVFAITGCPGMGKTELAKAFAAECCLGENIPYRLRYENIILTTYLKDGLAATIRNLPVEGTCDEKDLEQRIWDGLRSLKKPKLLMIDNVDIDPDGQDWDEKVYNDLIKTGFHILFTSRRDLHKLLEINSIAIPPIETDQLVKLFCDISGEVLDGEQTSKLESLIETHLQNNVYLVTLVAGLMESVMLETVIAAFDTTGDLGKLDAVADSYKDGRRQKPDTLTGHFAKLYHMSDLTPSEKRLMMNLALLPVDGMYHEEFFESAFVEQDRKDAKTEFKYLRDKYWVKQEQRKVSLHPMVREVIFNEMEESYNSDICMYLQNLADSMNHTHYSLSLYQKLQYGLAAMEAIKARKIKSFEAAQVQAQIASIYDTLADKKNAYEHGMKAVKRLDAQDKADLTDEDLFRLAQCYNVVGYAILHGRNTAEEERNKDEFRKKKIAAAKKAMTEAEMILKELKHKMPTQEKTDLLLSKVSGNTAACFHEEGDYIRSRDLHEEALRYRLEVNRMSGGKYRDMVASAYKNVATEYFYLSRTVDQKHNLEKSYENHCKAVKIYDELGVEYKLEWCIAVNRMVGTGLKILETDQHTDKAVLADYLKMMISVFFYLSSIDVVKDELKNSLGNIVRIIKLQEVDGVSRDSAVEIIRLSKNLPKETQEELQELLNAVQKVI